LANKCRQFLQFETFRVMQHFKCIKLAHESKKLFKFEHQD
jgi:hypothetical protein